jgi:hypothetical protein
VIASVNAGLYLPGLIVGVIIGFALARVSSTFQSRYGRLPWGIPSWGWFLFGFVLGLIGIVLYLIAHATTKRQLNRTAGYYAPPPASPPPSATQQPWSQPVGTQPPPPPPGSLPYPTSGPTGQPPPPVYPPPVYPPPVDPPPVDPPPVDPPPVDPPSEEPEAPPSS